ncbi:uncharacterized protein LOC116845168 isoform X2 [Odontomachus brunneus]|nr:uncharacterized protein LOC116845168 isoform X2 [Odontomachus brunneus]XP_032673450.1 uncharacterized protein LOC116845168 isoform X2 [Odontomachus brunneus]
MNPPPNRRTVTIEFKCRTYQLNALLCRKEKHKQYPSKMPTLVNIDDSYKKNLFQIRFNDNGVTDYAVERTDDNTMDFMLNMYRLLGSQFSVGVELDVSKEYLTFESIEQSVIGKCSTNFEVSHMRIKNQTRILHENVTLTHENYFFEEKETIYISKERYAPFCETTSSYMFGNNFWSEFIPNDISEEIISSHSLMTLSKHNFQSKTQNTFKLYDQNMTLIGNAVESVEVFLKSILPPEDFPSRIFLKPIVAGVIAEGSISNIDSQ